MNPDVVQEIRAVVRGGFFDEEEIVTQFAEERFEPGELDVAEVRAVVARERDELRREQKTWLRPTDCDRLTHAFEALRRAGIVALENAGYTQSDGLDDVVETFATEPPGAPWIGYCFFHGQDLERAVAGGGLFLAFGPKDASKEESEGPAIGRRIVAELERQGLSAQWNGTFAERIHVTPFDWRKPI